MTLRSKGFDSTNAPPRYTAHVSCAEAKKTKSLTFDNHGCLLVLAERTGLLLVSKNTHLLLLQREGRQLQKPQPLLAPWQCQTQARMKEEGDANDSCYLKVSLN